MKRGWSVIRNINEQMNTGCHSTQPEINFITQFPKVGKMLQGKGQNKNPEPINRARVCLEVSHSLKGSFLLPQEKLSTILTMPILQQGLPWKWKWKVSLRFLSIQSLLCLEPSPQTLSLVALLLHLPKEPFSNHYPATTGDQDCCSPLQWLPS